jgi:hypothetical protein
MTFLAALWVMKKAFSIAKLSTAVGAGNIRLVCISCALAALSYTAPLTSLRNSWQSTGNFQLIIRALGAVGVQLFWWSANCKIPQLWLLRGLAVVLSRDRQLQYVLVPTVLGVF